jgi:uncharacterized DUF497 family protein
MEISYDPEKRAATLAERGLDFEDAPEVFNGHTWTEPDLRRNYGEPRFRTIGQLRDRVVMIVWTPRSNARHVISMRKCNEREQAAYRQRLGES